MLVFGKNVATEVINSKTKIKKVFVTKNFDNKYILDYLRNNNIKIINMDKREMDEKYGKGVQGIVLDIEDYEYHELNEVFDSNFVVILDHLEDPHNLGAIIRTSEAAGVSGIIIPKDRGVSINATVIKTSTGAIDNIPISMVTNLSNTISDLKKNGFWIVGTDMVNSTDYREIDYSGKIALVIGNEGSGMSRMVRESCDFIARIPMYGKVNSLNASVAAGIMIYEVVRQKRR